MIFRLYLLTNPHDLSDQWDVYRSAIVCSASEQGARHLHPRETENNKCWWEDHEAYGPVDSWCLPEVVQVRHIGEAAEGIKPGTVLCTSFKAG
jgi:hypothetical protein